MEEELKILIKNAVREVIEELDLNSKTQDQDSYPEIMDLKQASEYIKLSAGYIKNAINTLGIPHKRAGSKYLFKKSALNAWMEQKSEEKHSKVNISSARSKGSLTRIV